MVGYGGLARVGGLGGRRCRETWTRCRILVTVVIVIIVVVGGCMRGDGRRGMRVLHRRGGLLRVRRDIVLRRLRFRYRYALRVDSAFLSWR